MASVKKTKATPAPKVAATVKSEAAAKKGEATTKETKAEPAEKSAEPAKADTADKATDKPSNYSRGEGQKVVTQAYKDNWNAIFAKKKKR